MLWNKKEKRDMLPDLPPMSSSFPESSIVPDQDHEDLEIQGGHGLPSFPDSPLKRGFAQAAIKGAVTNQESENTEIVGAPENEKNFKVVEMEDSEEIPKYNSSITARKHLTIMPAISEQILPEPISHPIKSSEPRGSDIFVKLDKFYSAKKSLSSTQDQLNSIESVLKKIRETKLREEQELNTWEKEIMQAKSRIQEIIKNIFDKT